MHNPRVLDRGSGTAPCKAGRGMRSAQVETGSHEAGGSLHCVEGREMSGGESLLTVEAQQLPELGAASTKTKPQTLREFERALREIGFSRGEAAAIAKGGFKVVQADSVSDQLEELAAVIRRHADNFK